MTSLPAQPGAARPPGPPADSPAVPGLCHRALGSCPVFRTIRTENLVERKAWQEGKSFLRLSARVAEELLEEGMAHLAQAKACHDILEELYHPHVDFSCAAEQTQRLTEEILALPDQTPADPLAPAFQL